MTYARFRTRKSGSTSPVFLGRSGTIIFPYCGYTEVNVNSPTRLLALQEECSDFVNPGPPYKEGHSFFLKRLTASYIDSDDVDVSHYFYRYKGKFTMGGSSASTEAEEAYKNYSKTAQSFGASAFAKARPAQPKVGLGQFFAEMRDFPSLFKVKLQKFKDLGNLYLNAQFGWRPFLKDMADWFSAAKSVDDAIARIRRDNGKWKKRRITLRDATTTTVVDWNFIIPILNSYLMWPHGQPPDGEKTLVLRDRIWFEAAMKYYIPNLRLDDGLTIGSSKLRRRLYGLDITPSLLWELLPWTWLLNWHINVKDLIVNFESAGYDNLVTKYAYVMRHRQTIVRVQSSQSTQQGPPICVNGRYVGHQDSFFGPLPIARAVFHAECKERERVCEWDVGNLGGELTPRQLSILLALGFQRFT